MEMQRINKNRKSGFTLIEIMVVVVILGMLAGIAVSNLIGRDEITKVQLTKVRIAEIEKAIQLYKMDNRNFPKELDDLLKPQANTKTSYLKGKDLYDMWEKKIEYIYPGEHGVFDLISYGADMKEGGENANADIRSWELDAAPSDG